MYQILTLNLHQAFHLNIKVQEILIAGSKVSVMLSLVNWWC